MTTNPIQNVQQAIVVEGSTLRPIQNPVQLELFDTDGNPWNPETSGTIDQLEGYATVETVQALETRIEALENAETDPGE